MAHPVRARARTADQQLYAMMEFCTTAEALWGKIASGHWDWLGVKGGGNRKTYVLGRPRLGQVSFNASISAREGDVDGQHRVEVRVPHNSKPTVHEYKTTASARAGYATTIEDLQKRRNGGSGLWRVRLVIENVTEDEELVVKTLPNVL